MAPVRKSGGQKNTLIVTVSLAPSKLREVFGEPPAKDASPVKDEEMETADNKDKDAKSVATPTEKEASPQVSGPPLSQENGENASESNPGTPAPSGTPASNGTPGPAAMGPPGKKGTKRSAPNGDAKPRKAPKKKARVDDGTGEPGTGRGGGGSHKLGPKANQGAINAGLRALDRSGKPCRKWAKGGFQLKSFTGVVWEIKRWKAPPRPAPEEVKEGESAEASATSSVKGNKEELPDKDKGKVDNASEEKSGDNTPNGVTNGITNGITNGTDGTKDTPNEAENTVNGGESQDVEMQSAPSIPATSPPPAPAVTAS